MKYGTRLAVGALVASLALPAAAAAHQRPSTGSVREHAKVAQTALARVETLIKANRDRAASRHLSRYRGQLRRANREATRLRRVARSGRSIRRAVSAERVVGVVADQCADVLSEIVGEAGSPVQLQSARMISTCINVREQVVELLTQLMALLPEPARPYVAQVIAMLTTGGQDDVAELGDALEIPNLSPEVGEALKQALELATQAIDMATQTLEGIVDLLPESARPLVQSALDMVSQQLAMVKTLLGDLLGGLLGGSQGGTGGSSGGGLGGILGLPFNLPFNLPFQLPGFGWATR